MIQVQYQDWRTGEEKKIEDQHMTVAKDVVQFLMDIFQDRQAAQEFLDDPERVLEDHGLGGVRSADVDAAMPVVLDYAPLSVNASNVDRDFNAGGNNAGTVHEGGGWNPLPGGGHDDHGHAVEQLAHIVGNYSYPSTMDDRGSATDHSLTHNVWADGDVEQWFDNDSVTVFADPALAFETDMSFADTRVDDFFDLHADTDAEVETAAHSAIPGNLIAESVNEDDPTFADVDVPDGELTFTQDDPAAIDIDTDIDDAGAEEAADNLDFGA